MIEYSVTIRTLGTAEEKYKRLMKSIDKLEPQPKEVIIVIPQGYQVPEEHCKAKERIVISKKGMIAQRTAGVQSSTTEYVLCCDDDVEFERDFVQKLYEPLQKQKYSVSAGPLYEFFPQKGKVAMMEMILGGAVPTIFNRDKYVTILKNTGWSYNRYLKENRLYPTDSLPGTVFMIRRIDFLNTHFEEEIEWAEKTGYAAIEDQILIYKMKLKGYRAVIVPTAKYKHNDGRTSVKNLKLEPIYATGFNHSIFFRKFIIKHEKNIFKKIGAKIAFDYWKIINWLYYRIRFKSNLNVSKAFRKSLDDAKLYCYEKTR